MSNNTKIAATADILGGDVFFATAQGVDPEYPNNSGLTPDGMYIRIVGTGTNNVAYISAFELDKSITIIDNMTKDKANKVDLDLLSSTVNEKATSEELQDAITVINTKADQTTVDEITETLATKADQTTVDEITETLATKGDAEDVEKLLTDVATLQELVSSLSNDSSITAITNQINYLNTEIQRRLTIDDLASTTTAINNLTASDATLSERMDNVEASVFDKASKTYVQGQITEVNTTLTNAIRKIETKADKTDIAGKANKADVDAVTANVEELTTTVDTLSQDVNTRFEELTTTVDAGASKAYVDSKYDDLTSQLDNVANKNVVGDAINRLTNRFETHEQAQATINSDLYDSIDDIQHEFANISSEFRGSINAQSRQITAHTDEISKLKESSQDYKDQLKQTWVRVLTSNEYKRLSTPPEGVPYNPRYKYPNTVYLVVDFNKPKAIYIGDILVAQAEAKGSVGFAYTFPIVF